jgi:topoisomerase IV subunit B
LSEWLVHTNRRRDDAWTQRYERGMPMTGLGPIPGNSATGTTVHFCPDETVRASGAHAVIDAVQLAASWRELPVVRRFDAGHESRIGHVAAAGRPRTGSSLTLLP